VIIGDVKIAARFMANSAREWGGLVPTLYPTPEGSDKFDAGKPGAA
jgi:hypothetical protein